jgi:hypothetical protein
MMAQTQIDGGTQIQSGTVTKTQTDSSLVSADGTRAFSGDQSMGSHKLTSVATPVTSTDAANKAYVDGAVQGLSTKASVQAATTGSETFTIASGSVTQITGTAIDGVSPAVGDRILIKDAPTSTGVGSSFSDKPGNGIYTVTSNTTNLAVSRTTDMSGAVNPAGAYVFSEAGTVSKGNGFVVIDPTTPDTAFTYGTTNMKWSQFSSAGSGVSSVSVATANGFAGSVSNPTTTPAITVSTTITGVLKGNGTAVSVATAGTDFMAPSDFITRETPTGTINGSNTTFTLANTPISGTEMVFLNGVLQDAGAGNDYTISGTTITMLSAPLSGDKIRASYQK